MINRHPVLSKGHVGILSAYPLKELITSTGKNVGDLTRVARVTLEVRSPIFIKDAFHSCGLSTIGCRADQEDSVEFYVPDLATIKGNDLESARRIRAVIEQNCEALATSTKGFLMDGCDPHISQVVSPIAMYNRYVVDGTLSSWISFLNKDDCRDVPVVSDYRSKIEDILLYEYPEIKEMVTCEKEINEEEDQEGSTD